MRVNPDGARMTLEIDAETLNAIFARPQIDGRFEGALAKYSRELSARRPLVLFAFAPRSAGTFFRTAAIEATGGQLGRIVHAEGGRDPAPYLPALIVYYMGAFTPDTLITHAHMQASIGNRNFIDAFDLKPIVMLRNIPDMLASFWDMIVKDPNTPMGLSFSVPKTFAAMPRLMQANFIVDTMAPWYVSYFATWLDYAEQSPGRVCILDYTDFREDPAGALELALAHARVPRSYDDCQRAFDETWKERTEFRYNRAEPGRGISYFTAEQIDRIERLISYHDCLKPAHHELMGSGDATNDLRIAV
jgi:hypothetical protein